ncbi:MAG TPA: beta-propeller domain-containing protein [Allosphingosinicella sp.]|nr:beta-propeller domain-containing protein [Allosphingosinicella sp.]
MLRGTILAAAALTFSVMGGGIAPAPASAQGTAGLSAFASDAELRAFLRRVIDERRRARENELPVPMPVPVPSPPSPGYAAAPTAPAAPGITNNQMAGVDEGDIVKLSGETLVILRRGRLFTVSLAGGGMRPVSAIDAFPPGVDARGDWYDEMLVAAGRVVVIGYSYRRRTTEVNRFRIDSGGRLTFEDSYQLRSSDYYSSRNYATRLIGNRLILYSPLSLREEGDPLDSLPALRPWRSAAGAQPAFRRIASARRVYIPRGLRQANRPDIDTLHSVTGCDLAAAILDCQATVVLGSHSRTFFVSSNAVYLWIEQDRQARRRANAMVYRLPFDRARPSAVAARGSPVDQFSFMPDARRNTLHVLVRSDGGGDAMWGPEVTHGDVALLSIPMAAFRDGAREVPLDRYRRLPKPEGASWNLQNRFVGDHLLYGSPSPRSGSVVAVSLADGIAARLPLSHGVERIDAIGRDGIVIGSGDNALGFTAIDLGGAQPRAAEEFRLPEARQGESRSHSFFFRPDPGSADGTSGLLGLPVARFVPGGNEWSPRVTAAMLFLKRSERRLAQAGELAGATVAGSDRDDACQASCVDWYGNARPIFIGGRLFALLGYELVEGREEAGRVREIGRISFAPGRSAR